MTVSLRAGSLAIALGLLAASAPAQDDPGRLDVLTLDRAVAQALDTNFGIRLARHDLASVQSGLLAEENVFDFKLSTHLSDVTDYERNVPVAFPNPIPGEPDLLVPTDLMTDDQRLSLNLERKARWGGTFGLETGLTRSNADFPANSIIGLTDPIDPLHQADVTFHYKQPLWGGAGRRVATASLVAAETALRSTTRSLAAEEMELVVDVTRAFHLVTRSESVIRIDREAVGRAEENLRTYRVRLEEGLITPIDVARAEAELRQRESVVVADEQALESSRDRLAFLLGIPVATELVLEEQEPLLEPLEIDLAGAVEEALAQRVSVQNQREDVALSELASHVARSGTRPRFDLDLAVGKSTIVDDEAQGYLKLDQQDDWSTNVDFVYTFGERADDEAYVRARIGEEEARLQLENLERAVELEVRDAVREVQALERTIALYSQNLDLARESLRLAQLQLQEDLIRTTDLLQIQSDLVQAETAYTNAVSDHAISLVNLDLVLGRYRTDPMERRSSFLRETKQAKGGAP